MGDEISGNHELVTNMIEALRSDPHADQRLVEILAEHIVKQHPAGNAVTDAAGLIEQLAQVIGEDN